MQNVIDDVKVHFFVMEKWDALCRDAVRKGVLFYRQAHLQTAIRQEGEDLKVFIDGIDENLLSLRVKPEDWAWKFQA